MEEEKKAKSTPDKVFFAVPRDANIRKQWCKVMRRDNVSPISRQHCCEDNFNDIRFRKKLVTSEQVKVLYEFMKEHPELELDRGINTDKLWSELAKNLNAIKGGAVKDRKGWSQYWCNWKYRIKRRYLLQKPATDSHQPLPEAFSSLSICNGEIDEVIIKTDPLEGLGHLQDDDNNSESDSIKNDMGRKVRSHKRSFGDLDLDEPQDSNCKRTRQDSSESSDHDDAAAQFIQIENQKLEKSNNIQKSLHTIANTLTRLTDVMAEIRDVLVNKINL